MKLPLSPFKQLIAAGSLGAMVACTQAAVVDFNSASDLSLFSINGTTDYAWDSASGTGGTGGLLDATPTTTNAATYNYNDASYDLVGGASSWTFSLDVKVAWSNGSNRAVAQLGFAGDLTDTFTNTTGHNFVTSRLSTVASLTDTWVLQSNYRNNSSAVITGALTSNFTLANNEWYRHTVTITRTGTTNVFNLAGALYSLGASGTDTPALVAGSSYDADVTVLAALYSDTSLWAGFRSRGTESPSVDNFSAIPEPSSGALIAAGVGLVTLVRRRHQTR